MPLDVDPGVVKVFDAGRKLGLPGTIAGPRLKAAGRAREWAAVVHRLVEADGYPDVVVRYGSGYPNAFFDGRYIVFGEGDGEVLGDFTTALDVYGHEVGHALVSTTSGLEYYGQPGALNEHLSDVLGICAAQLDQGDSRDWRLGEEVFLDGKSALRDMLSPGTAYDSPLLGRDPQPGHMEEYVDTTADNGGVHINSGIPNRAFALLSESLGEPSWGVPWELWREAMGHLWARSSFAAFAKLTWLCARSDTLRLSVREAWGAVGVQLSPWPGPAELRS